MKNLKLSRAKSRRSITVLNPDKTKGLIYDVGSKTTISKIIARVQEKLVTDSSGETLGLFTVEGTQIDEKTLKQIPADSLLIVKRVPDEKASVVTTPEPSQTSPLKSLHFEVVSSTEKDTVALKKKDKSKWVKLNVGGKIIVTTRSTLVKEKESMLASMFGEDIDWSSTSDETGAYLIDRTPKYFVPVLNYLRSGSINIDDGVSVEGVLNEAKFFNVQSMIEPLNKLLIQSTREISRKDLVSILLTSSTNCSLRCQGLNLSGIDLSRLDLSGINFRMTSLRYANLSECNLDNTQMEGADLEGANLERASLRGANLSGANLHGANLRGANFEDRGGRKANLESCNLMECNLEDGNLAGALLRAAKLKDANLENSNLRSCDLAGANLEGSNLRGCNLHKANLKGANLVNSKFDIRSVSSR